MFDQRSALSANAFSDVVIRTVERHLLKSIFESLLCTCVHVGDYSFAPAFTISFLTSASSLLFSGSHPAIKSSTTFVSSCPHINPPTGFHCPFPSFLNTRYVGTPQIPTSLASAVKERSFALMSGALAFLTRSGPSKPPSVRTLARTASSETF